jgi:hypothetical protein
MVGTDTSLLPSADPDALLRIGAEFRRVQIFAKAEWFNPGGSVKDRLGYRMIRAAELSGEMMVRKAILDVTRRSRVQIPSSPPIWSGNRAVALRSDRVILLAGRRS